MSETVEALRALDEAWKLFDRLPAEASIPTELAAVFLGVSERKLARMRASGEGPPYLQYPEGDTVKRNQRVNYVLSDLRVWREGSKIKNTMDAAVRRGITFATLPDLMDEQPFWQRRVLGGDFPQGSASASGALILGHALLAPDNAFREWLDASLGDDATVELVFLPLAEALRAPWVDPQTRAPLHKAYAAVLREEANRSDAEQDAAELRAVTGIDAATPVRRRPRRPL
ncbi:hypothetical protein BX589_101147 [Paraburkholderia fungorum]|jgi:hypothetical protein|uniref:hypothetical protein n=1 Tax=Paraburkholderia fungorum TaxID=134537 RepID=UPI000D083AB6|nr:hypothetical protein [Paraburkholderia fungorum]PRZ56497.1 hypothetical protein BX589_101147 [Paraburkholderia fungorum]